MDEEESPLGVRKNYAEVVDVCQSKCAGNVFENGQSDCMKLI
jgi:hypothetical protein